MTAKKGRLKKTKLKRGSVRWHVYPADSIKVMIYYVQELGAEIAQLEKQRDELEADLKRVIYFSIYRVSCFILEVYIHTLNRRKFCHLT